MAPRKSPSDLRVLDLSPRKDQATKPRELIQVTGHQSLNLAARRAITILWHNAHRQGISENKSYTIELSELRTPSSHDNTLVEDAVLALMKTIISVTRDDGSTTRVQFLGGNNMHDPRRPQGVLTYNFDKFLIEILQDSKIWGKISLPVIMSFSSKYAITLYENVAQWSGLDFKTHATYSIQELRELLGVEEHKYELFGTLNKDVIKPALAEINALAPFNLGILFIKTSRQVTHVRLNWWTKSIDEHKAAWSELNKTKIGRKARIHKRAEYIAGPAPDLVYLTHKNGKD